MWMVLLPFGKSLLYLLPPPDSLHSETLLRGIDARGNACASYLFVCKIVTEID